jgi:two-component sensor histidine kinase
MKKDRLIQLRKVSTYFLLFSGVMVSLWFFYVVIHLIFEIGYYTGEFIEWTYFILAMMAFMIGIPLAINLILSLVLITNTPKAKEVILETFLNPGEKKIIKYLLGLTFILFITAVAFEFKDRTQEEKNLKNVTERLVKNNETSFSKLFYYLSDSISIMETKELLDKMEGKSEEISSIDVLFQLKDKDSIDVGMISWRTKDSLLVSGTIDDLKIALMEEEQDLVFKMFDSEITEPTTLRLPDGRVRGYHPLHQNKKVLVLRMNPPYRQLFLGY